MEKYLSFWPNAAVPYSCKSEIGPDPRPLCVPEWNGRQFVAELGLHVLLILLLPQADGDPGQRGEGSLETFAVADFWSFFSIVFNDDDFL